MVLFVVACSGSSLRTDDAGTDVQPADDGGRADVESVDVGMLDVGILDSGPVPQANVDDMWTTIQVLTSPSHAGRLPGSAGIELSRAHILSRLERLGSSVDIHEFAIVLGDSSVTGMNLVVHLPGTGGLADETVVVLAHYDHLGQVSGGDSYFPGAVDNAGGVAALLELIRGWPGFEAGDRRAVDAVFTDGEELGLLGARAWRDSLAGVTHLASAVSVDGFGVLMGPSHTQGFGIGTDTATAIHMAVLDANRSTEFSVLPLPYYVLSGRSDHAAFHERSVPVLHFVTGSPPEIYHSPADQLDVIDRSLLEPAARWLSYFVRELTVSERPVWDPNSERTCSDSALSFSILLRAFRADAADPSLQARIDSVLPLIEPYAGFDLTPPRQAQCDALLQSIYSQVEAELIP